MLKTEIEKQIELLPMMQSQKDAMATLIPFLEKTENILPYNLYRIINKLHEIKYVVPKRHMTILFGTICILRRVHCLKYIDEGEPDNHPVSDHAFCAGLRRYFNVDLSAEKEKMLQIAQRQKWAVVRKNGKITTFYPRLTNA